MVLCGRWGVTLPINQDCRLGNMIDAEQAAALCEALTGLDASDVRRANVPRRGEGGEGTVETLRDSRRKYREVELDSEVEGSLRQEEVERADTGCWCSGTPLGCCFECVRIKLAVIQCQSFHSPLGNVFFRIEQRAVV